MGYQVVLADDAIAVPDEINQKIEDLRFDRNQIGAAPQFAPVDVKVMLTKENFHDGTLPPVGSGRFPTNYQAFPKDKPSSRQSLGWK